MGPEAFPINYPSKLGQVYVVGGGWGEAFHVNE
jgi:hypothetical protein